MLFLVAGFLALIAGAAAAIGVAVGVVLAMLGVAAAVVHVFSAWLVRRSRPRTRVLFRRQIWAMLTVAFGPIWAGVYWLLHWGRRVTPCCNVCGYVRTELDAWLTCPECSTAYPARVPKADIRVGRA